MQNHVLDKKRQHFMLVQKCDRIFHDNVHILPYSKKLTAFYMIVLNI